MTKQEETSRNEHNDTQISNNARTGSTNDQNMWFNRFTSTSSSPFVQMLYKIQKKIVQQLA